MLRYNSKKKAKICIFRVERETDDQRTTEEHRDRDFRMEKRNWVRNNGAKKRERMTQKCLFKRKTTRNKLGEVKNMKKNETDVQKKRRREKTGRKKVVCGGARNYIIVVVPLAAVKYFFYPNSNLFCSGWNVLRKISNSSNCKLFLWNNIWRDEWTWRPFRFGGLPRYNLQLRENIFKKIDWNIWM